jgi:hypothetical protein
MDDLVEHVLAVLSTTPERWRALAQTVQGDLLARAPAPGEWSALDCLRHLVAVEREVFPVRLAAFLEGRDFAAYDADAAGTTSGPNDPAELVAELERLRAHSLQALARLQPGDLLRTARHAELGPVTLGEMLHEWAGHDLMHTVQAERALMQPFIAGSGPWRGYFADHEVKGAVAA